MQVPLTESQFLKAINTQDNAVLITRASEIKDRWLMNLEASSLNRVPRQLAIRWFTVKLIYPYKEEQVPIFQHALVRAHGLSALIEANEPQFHPHYFLARYQKPACTLDEAKQLVSELKVDLYHLPAVTHMRSANKTPPDSQLLPILLRPHLAIFLGSIYPLPATNAFWAKPDFSLAKDLQQLGYIPTNLPAPVWEQLAHDLLDTATSKPHGLRRLKQYASDFADILHSQDVPALTQGFSQVAIDYLHLSHHEVLHWFHKV